jgi:hypothetical protein
MAMQYLMVNSSIYATNLTYSITEDKCLMLIRDKIT